MRLFPFGELESGSVFSIASRLVALTNPCSHEMVNIKKPLIVQKTTTKKKHSDFLSISNIRNSKHVVYLLSISKISYVHFFLWAPNSFSNDETSRRIVVRALVAGLRVIEGSDGTASSIIAIQIVDVAIVGAKVIVLLQRCSLAPNRRWYQHQEKIHAKSTIEQQAHNQHVQMNEVLQLNDKKMF
jgi:hypothetical protein